MSNLNGKPNKKLASALKYDVGKDNAPYVVAIGQGHVADRIIEEGKEHDVSIVEDKPLARMLQSLRVGDEIPQEMYQAVAQILVFINELDNEYSKQAMQRRIDDIFSGE